MIDDSYNSNPISLKNSLDFLSEYKNNSKKVAVIGDMLELGKFSKKLHIKIAKYINKSKIVVMLRTSLSNPFKLLV